jgi:hypothetical protein
MDAFALLSTATTSLGLSPLMAALMSGIVAVSLGSAIINLMRGEPATAIKFGIGGAAFLAVLYSFSQISGALAVI